MEKNFSKSFLLILVFLVLVACYFVFRPFLIELFVAAVLATVFYRPFEYLVKLFKGRKNLAALAMCLILVLIIILPTTKFLIWAGERSVSAYNSAVEFFNQNTIDDLFAGDTFRQGILAYLPWESYDVNSEALQDTVLAAFKQTSNWLLSGATFALRETASFAISLLFIIISMFFFFVDGKNMLHRLMYLSPLPNKYDREIFRKFRAVSHTTFLSTFVAALAQGIVGAIAFFIVGFPALLAGALIALLSLLPYLGSAIFYVPVGIYYLLIGSIWQGIFILLWGFLIISTIDNVIRSYMIKGKAEINPIFVFFSILGGILFFGFWGILLGPLVLALAVTIFHIYELEFCESLEMDECEDERKELERRDRRDLKAEQVAEKAGEKAGKRVSRL